jgi:hypothetical protein
MQEVKSEFISHKDPNLWVNPDNTGLYPEGCHTYYLLDCLGWDNEKGKTAFVIENCTDPGNNVVVNGDLCIQAIRFVQKSTDGSLMPGVTSEQLLNLLEHRHVQMNVAFPSGQNQEFLMHIRAARDLLAERVKDRVNRGVMGDLKK